MVFKFSNLLDSNNSNGISNRRDCRRKIERKFPRGKVNLRGIGNLEILLFERKVFFKKESWTRGKLGEQVRSTRSVFHRDTSLRGDVEGQSITASSRPPTSIVSLFLRIIFQKLALYIINRVRSKNN